MLLPQDCTSASRVETAGPSCLRAPLLERRRWGFPPDVQRTTQSSEANTTLTVCLKGHVYTRRGGGLRRPEGADTNSPKHWPSRRRSCRPSFLGSGGSPAASSLAVGEQGLLDPAPAARKGCENSARDRRPDGEQRFDAGTRVPQYR